jgi:serpin B
VKNIEDFTSEVYQKATEKKKKINLRKKAVALSALCLCVVLALTVVTSLLPGEGNPNNESKETVKTTPLPMTGIADLMAGIQGEDFEYNLDNKLLESTAELYLKLTKAVAQKGENLVFSPVSAHLALAMTANGAAKDTLKAMEKVLAGGKSVDKLNEFLASYADVLESDHLKIANSLWIREGRIEVYKDFLNKNAAYYNAGAFYADFDNPETINSINKWIEDNTNEMIKDMLKVITPEHIMFLINAIAFEAEWQKDSVQLVIEDRDFTNYNGTTSKVTQFLYSRCLRTFSLKGGQGVLMPYKDCNYSFAAILPKEGEDVYDFLNSIDGKDFVKAVKGAKERYAYTYMPEFEIKSSLSLNKSLEKLGMGIAFDPVLADFSRLGEPGGIFIDFVKQDAAISVTREGTKASAATIVAMDSGGGVKPEIYIFDRPFVYAIIDNTTNLPVFIGVCASMEG